MNTKILLDQVTGDSYTTVPEKPGICTRTFKSLSFYLAIVKLIIRGSARGKRGEYDKAYWLTNSQHSTDAVERVGGMIEVNGLNNLRKLDGPCVIVANHMSSLETIMLPAIIVPILDATFVVKDSLTRTPFIKNIVCSTNPIAVSRTNPREDLKKVLSDGQAMLASGRSIIIFPQTTRTKEFIPEKFNSIGAKLAARAAVPLVPLALSTSFWGNGRIIKDIGKIDINKKVRYLFGEPIHINGKGNAEHKQVVEFISRTLASWAEEDTL